MRWMFIAVIAAIATIAAQAAERQSELKRGAGRDLVVAHCNACHSLDYIEMNAGFLDLAGWDAEVAKMIRSFGAPIDANDAKAIAAYLGATYGPRPQPVGPRAAGGGGLRRRYASFGIRPKSPAAQPPGRVDLKRSPPANGSWTTAGVRGPHAASRRSPAPGGPFTSLFSTLAQASTCKTTKAEKYRVRAPACEYQLKREAPSSSRQARWRWSWPWSQEGKPRS
jgi:hypothetical protein